ncbi:MULTISPECIES: DUF4350 domain-containing protein [unclassified Pseudomonas]|uniref:DUF4350 domain-containing protein n=1 Tax=unclassified Pseudomonas TaxID=196821 RepID=UPI000C86C849|nr:MULTISPECIES: DUF4350 domain-containing protein [unclassified Pseudomonas]PMV23098.1 DUF4350 domain-containing protein [Pseudomonas sp. FW305-3-2-15-C-TSA2]PMV29705.1 DUF4350 domain-containing protein [Pseudomonas sp. DP16D-L5]PMV39927.1 DUF4350 domain-containing protein [Pseudomonas sp. FW305-3-2-15-A-LB2]PMV46256.1 DUF4350 domain-containing protein [Pseudomonas sp. FW305-3-2-15-C-R2A1]PMV51638.1 DUF4350 domain-containing protein [Pseudomonas sp. FW305-3-2-15-C-LB1]
MNRPLLWVGLLLACLLGAGGYYAWSKATPYDEVVDRGPSPEALANPYLAAEHFLRQQGLTVEHAYNLKQLDTLPSKGNSLLLLGERSNMSPRQVEQLLEWTRSGGHLLLVAEALWDEETGKSGDLLLDRLQIHQTLSDEPEEPATSLKKPSSKKARDLTKLYVDNETAPAYFSFDTDFNLTDPKHLAQFSANSARASHLMQLDLGEGSVTVITDSDLWKTPNIGKHDNAWLLWYLNQGTAVTLLFTSDFDDLFTLLMRYFPQALVALTALVALGLWRAGVRQGPIRAPASPARRQLQEHLKASADFLLRRSGQGTLLQALQRDILRAARRRHPGFERLDNAEQRHVLEHLTRQPSHVINQALGPLPAKRLSSADFSRQVACLQTLRNAL